MFALTENMRYYLYQHYVDMRKGMTGFYVGIRMVLFFTRSAWKKVPSKSRVLILLRVLTSFPGRVSF